MKQFEGEPILMYYDFTLVI